MELVIGTTTNRLGESFRDKIMIRIPWTLRIDDDTAIIHWTKDNKDYKITIVDLTQHLLSHEIIHIVTGQIMSNRESLLLDKTKLEEIQLEGLLHE